MKGSAIRIIGVAGGSGSGKTTFARELQKLVGEAACGILSQDHYYIDQSARFTGDGESVNFDHPEALDFPLLRRHLLSLRDGAASVEVPIYDSPTHRRLERTRRLEARRLLVVDGTLILSQPGIRECFDESVFIETPEDIRFERRYRRDLVERGRQPEGIRKQYFLQVKPMHDLFVEPSKAFAGEIIPGTEEFARYLGRFAI